MSLSPYSNSPVTACFVSVTSTAKGLSKSTFQKMKRGCSPDDKPNFSIDKRRRFFHLILSVLCCVYLFKCSCFLSSFSLMYINLDLSGGRTKTWWWWNRCSEEPKSIRRATEKRRKRELGPKNGRPPRYPLLKGFPSVELRCRCRTLQAPRPSVLWKHALEVAVFKLCLHVATSSVAWRPVTLLLYQEFPYSGSEGHFCVL